MRKRARSSDGAELMEPVTSAASLTRGLDILRAFTREDATLGNQDLIERTGLPRATVSRLTQTLTNLGYLTYVEALGRYSIGPATVSLGYSALSSNPVIHIALPFMQELADWTGAAVALGARDGLEMVYLANCRSMSPVTLQLNVGSRLPIARTAMGLAYLADLAEEPRDRLVRALESVGTATGDKFASNLKSAIRDYRELGFVAALGSWHSYINAVGIAFRPADGSSTVVITCGGIVDILPEDHCRKNVGPKLVELVEKLRQGLAGTGGRDGAIE